MSRNILSLSLAVMLSLTFLSACTQNPGSPKAPNVPRGEVREERNENEETGRGNRDDDTRNTQNQVVPQPAAPVQETTSVQVQAQTPATITPTPVTPSAPTSQTKTVTKTVSYQVPEGSATNTFTVSIDADGTISSVTSTMAKGSHDSQMFNRIFASSISAQVIGKKPSSVANLSAVGWASLTTAAFKSFVASM